MRWIDPWQVFFVLFFFRYFNFSSPFVFKPCAKHRHLDTHGSARMSQSQWIVPRNDRDFTQSITKYSETVAKCTRGNHFSTSRNTMSIQFLRRFVHNGPALWVSSENFVEQQTSCHGDFSEKLGYIIILCLLNYHRLLSLPWRRTNHS